MSVNYKFNFGPTIDIQFNDGDQYLCELSEYSLDGNHKLVHCTIIKDMHFYKPFREWYTKWVINIYKIKDNRLKLVDCHYFNLQGKNVLFVIDFDDNLSIFQSINVINEFTKIYDCKSYIDLNYENEFIKNYIKNNFPKLKFKQDINYYASYHIGKYDIEEFSIKKFGVLEFSYPQIADYGYYYDSFRNKTNWLNLTVAQVTCDILNIKYEDKYEIIEIDTIPSLSIKKQNIQYNNMKEKLINLYESTTIINKKQNIDKIKYDDKIDVTFNYGPQVEILGNSPNEYKIEFIDDDSELIVYRDSIKPQHWSKASRQWYTNWRVKVYNNNTLLVNHKISLKNKNVFILLDSKSLGDTLAWMPYVEEFRKKHECILTCATFWNKIFKSEYSNINFILPDTNPETSMYASYTVCWTTNKSRNKTDIRISNLQEVACDCLGLDFFELGEIKPKIFVQNTKNRFRDKYICIAPHSTTQAKYWNNETGWQEVVNYVKTNLKYNTVCISREGDDYMGNKLPKAIIDQTGDLDIQLRITDIINCEFFVGVSSGLSWLAWSLGKKVIMISGCTSWYNEFSDCIRIKPEDNICSSCFNDVSVEFDDKAKGDWNWCPYHKGTERQFECSKTILGNYIIKEIYKII